MKKQNEASLTARNARDRAPGETPDEATRLLQLAIEHMDQGLVLLGSDQTVRLFNSRAHQLLRLPETVLHEHATFRDIRTFQNQRGDFSLVPAGISTVIQRTDVSELPLLYDWPRPDGTTLEVRRVQLPNGSSVNTFTDVTERRAAEAALRESELRYRILSERLDELAQVDELTGTLNRRYILRGLSEETARSQRCRMPCTVAIIDLDHFKNVNDRFGHPAGDEVLRSFAIAVAANVRDIDRFGRYGGEEFVLIMPQASAGTAAVALDRLRIVIAQMDWRALSKDLIATVSIGATEVRANDSPDDLLARADAALYLAKNAGRNCVMFG